MRAAVLVLLGFISTLAVGCSTIRKGDALAAADLSRRQQQWWEENSHRATPVEGRGYYVQQVGYFEQNGRLISAVGKPYDWLPKEPEEEAEGTSIGKILSPDGIVAKGKRLIGRGKDTKLAKELYGQGEESFRLREYAQAKSKYRGAAKRWPDSALEEDAMFKAAECDFFMDKYANADDGYDALLKKYSNSRHLEQISRRQFAIAGYWQKLAAKSSIPRLVPKWTGGRQPLMDTPGRALKLYESVFEKNGRGDLADEALMAMADTFYREGRFNEADVYYTMLRREYPHSPHQFQAHLRGMHAKLQMYQGSDYVDKPLLDAEQLVKQLLQQFPTEVATVRDSVMKARKEILALRAQRDWETAEYYAKGRHYRAARQYYNQIVREYPNTSTSKQALARLDAHKGKPDVAPHPLEWAFRWLPSGSTSKEPDTRVATDPRPSGFPTHSH